MSDAQDIEAVVAEIEKKVKRGEGLIPCAARLILEARRERDTARQAALALQVANRDAAIFEAMPGVQPTEAERWMAEATEQLQRLTRERDTAREEAAQWARQHHQLGTELDGALARPSTLTTALDAQLPSDEMLRTLTLVRGLLREYVADCGKYLDRIVTLEADLAAAGQRAELEIAARLKAEAEGATNARLAELVRQELEFDPGNGWLHLSESSVRAALAEGEEK